MQAGGSARRFPGRGSGEPAGGFWMRLARRSGAAVASETTVVLDASKPPATSRAYSTYHGLTVLFALGDENADAGSKLMIREHSSPKALTVVSSDNRIRLAASRRRCRSLTAEQFWELIDTSEGALAPDQKPARDERKRVRQSQDGASQDDVSYWLGVFGELDETPEIRQGFAPDVRC